MTVPTECHITLVVGPKGVQPSLYVVWVDGDDDPYPSAAILDPPVYLVNRFRNFVDELEEVGLQQMLFPRTQS